jgi:hypothetical protein
VRENREPIVTRREEGHYGGGAVLALAQAEPVVVSGGAPVEPGEDDHEHQKRIEALTGEKSTMSRNVHMRETQGWK